MTEIAIRIENVTRDFGPVRVLGGVSGSSSESPPRRGR